MHPHQYHHTVADSALASVMSGTEPTVILGWADWIRHSLAALITGLLFIAMITIIIVVIKEFILSLELEIVDDQDVLLEASGASGDLTRTVRNDQPSPEPLNSARQGPDRASSFPGAERYAPGVTPHENTTPHWSTDILADLTQVSGEQMTAILNGNVAPPDESDIAHLNAAQKALYYWIVSHQAAQTESSGP